MKKQIERIKLLPSSWVDHVYSPAVFIHWEPWLISFGIVVLMWQLEIEVYLKQGGTRR